MKLFKYIGLLTILLFSIYYTEKMNNIITNNSKLVMEINDNANNYKIKPVSAVINGDYIIPGLNGYTVNVLKSYDNMKFLDTFNSYYLEYDVVKPNISISNNKSKIIKYGNKAKNEVAIIIKDNNEIIDYANSNNIIINRIVDINTFNKNNKYIQLNGESNNYDKLELLLNKYNLNNNICLINNKNNCNNKYLIEPSIIINKYNISTTIDKIKSGYIIYINDNVKLSDFKLLIKQIIYNNLTITSINNLISEERD